MQKEKMLSRRHLIDKLVTDNDINEALDVMKAAVINGDLKAAKDLIDIAVGTKKDFDSMLLTCQKNALEMLRYLMEKGIGNGMAKDELLELINNFDISKFIPVNIINTSLIDDTGGTGGTGGERPFYKDRNDRNAGRGRSVYRDGQEAPPSTSVTVSRKMGERERQAREQLARKKQEAELRKQALAALSKRPVRIFAEDNNPDAWD